MADPHSGKEENEIISRSLDTLTTRESPILASDPPFLRDLIELTKHDFELRQKELEIHQQQVANEHEYTKLTLNARITERNAERAAARNARLETMLFSLIGAAFLGVVLIICMRMGREQFAIEAIKNLALVLISGYGGYQYAARKFSREKD